jgi:hypothetical protein
MIEDLKGFLKEGVNIEEVSRLIDEKRLDFVKSPEDALKIIDGNDVFKAARDKLKTELLKKNDEKHAALLADKVEEEIKRRNPAKSEAELRIEKLEKQLLERDNAVKRADITKKLDAKADSLSLPVELKSLTNFFIADDEETSLKNLDVLASAYEKVKEAAKKEILSKYGRAPDAGGDAVTSNDIDKQIAEAKAKGNWAMVMALTNQKKNK